MRIHLLAGQEKIEPTKVIHLLPPFTHVLFGPISRSYQTGSWCKGLHECLCGFDLSPYFFSDCLSPCLISYLWPTVLNAAKENNCGRNVYLNPNVLICFCCARLFVLLSVLPPFSDHLLHCIGKKYICFCEPQCPPFIYLLSILNTFVDFYVCVSIQPSIFSMSVLKSWA